MRSIGLELSSGNGLTLGLFETHKVKNGLRSAAGGFLRDPVASQGISKGCLKIDFEREAKAWRISKTVEFREARCMISDAGRARRNSRIRTTRYLIKKLAPVTGRRLRSAAEPPGFRPPQTVFFYSTSAEAVNRLDRKAPIACKAPAAASRRPMLPRKPCTIPSHTSTFASTPAATARST